MERLKKMWRTLYRTIAVLINNLYCIPTYVVWCLLLQPLYLVSPELYWRIEGQFFQWLLTMVAYWSYSAGYYIVETGDTIESLLKEETLVLVNHQSTSDVPLLMYAFCARGGLLEKLNWIMDAVFQYTNFGIVSTLHGDFFINAGRDKRDASLKDLENYLKTKFLPKRRKWLVLFPEGGFLRKRKDASKRYASKMNLPNLDYVTLPRLGALQTIINTLAPADMKEAPLSTSSFGSGDRKDVGKLKYIIDMTIAYSEGEPLDLGSVITGNVPPCNVRMHYKIYPINEVPHDKPEEMQAWLYNIYIEKNNMLGHYYKTGLWDPKFAKLDINRSSKDDTSSDSGINTNSMARNSSSSDVVDDARPPSKIFDDSIESPIKYSSTPIIKNSAERTAMELEEELSSLDDDECIYEPSSDEERNQIASRDKTLHLDLLRITILHAMFIASTLLHITAFRMVFQWIKILDEE